MRTGAHTIFIQFSDASTPLDNGLLHPHHPGDTPHANAVLHIRDKSQRNIPTCTATSRGESKGPLRRGTGGEQGRRRQQDGQDVRYRYVHPACPQSTKTPLTNPPVLIVKPSASTTIRHNGEQGTPPPPPPPTQLTPPPSKKRRHNPRHLRHRPPPLQPPGQPNPTLRRHLIVVVVVLRQTRAPRPLPGGLRRRPGMDGTPDRQRVRHRRAALDRHAERAESGRGESYGVGWVGAAGGDGTGRGEAKWRGEGGAGAGMTSRGVGGGVGEGEGGAEGVGLGEGVV